MATSPIPSSPLAEAMKLHANKSDTTLSRSKLHRIRHETEQSHSSSSSASDLSCKKGTGLTPQPPYGFKPINQCQEEDEMLESGGMFDIEVGFSFLITVWQYGVLYLRACHLHVTNLLSLFVLWKSCRLGSRNFKRINNILSKCASHFQIKLIIIHVFVFKYLLLIIGLQTWKIMSVYYSIHTVWALFIMIIIVAQNLAWTYFFHRLLTFRWSMLSNRHQTKNSLDHQWLICIIYGPFLNNFSLWKESN